MEPSIPTALLQFLFDCNFRHTQPLPQPTSIAENGVASIGIAIFNISLTEFACPLSIPSSLFLRAHSENTSVASRVVIIVPIDIYCKKIIILIIEIIYNIIYCVSENHHAFSFAVFYIFSSPSCSQPC